MYRKVLRHLHTRKPFEEGQADHAEALALATSRDLLINGDFLRCGDPSAQRFKDQGLATQSSWQVASQLELTDPRRSLITSKNKARATKAAAQQSRLERKVAGRKP